MNKNVSSGRCIHYSLMPIGMKTLYTATIMVLGTGYLFAMIHIFESHAGRDGNPMLSVQDLIIAYSGSKADTRLEAALKGPMANMLSTNEKDEIISWVRREAKESEYDKIKPIMEQRCVVCHGGNNPHIPDLSDYNKVMQTVQVDTGMDIFTLVRVSHIHLFGITFIFFIMGSIFCHAYMKRKWLKCLILATPFLAILADILSWYLTKIFEPFAWVVMLSGAAMGACFAAQGIIAVYQMWFLNLPEELAQEV